jgi:hypothetical protein
LNLGISSNGPLFALADLKEYAAKFRPRAVLWCFYEQNDFADLVREAHSPLLMRYLEHHFAQGLPHVQPDIDKALEQYLANRMERLPSGWPDAKRAMFPSIIRLGNLRQRIGAIYGEGTSSDLRIPSEHTMQLLARILLDARVTVDSWGGKFYLVYLPERHRYADPRTAELDDANRERVLSIARSLAIQVIDVHSAFESHGDPLGLFPFRRRGHYNEKGHRLVGETVLQSISLDHGGPALSSDGLQRSGNR